MGSPSHHVSRLRIISVAPRRVDVRAKPRRGAGERKIPPRRPSPKSAPNEGSTDPETSRTFFSPRRADLAPLRASQRFGFEGRGRSPRLDSSARRAKGRDIWDGRAQNPRCYPKFKLFARASAAHTRAQHDVRHGTRRHHAQDDGGSREQRDDGSHVDFPNAERTHERVERGDPIERERRTKRGCFEVRRVRADRRGTRRDAVARAVPALPAPRARRDRLRALTPDPPSRARSPQTPPRRPPGLSLAPSTMTCQRC